jgi:thymidylate synthase
MLYKDRIIKKSTHPLVMNRHIEVGTLDDAWEYWFSLLSKQGLSANSRDGGVVGEIINATTVIKDPTHCILRSPVRKLPMRYLVGELLWYMSGNPRLDAIRNYTDTWDRMSDNDITVNSNYGERIKYHYGFDQYEYVKELLIKDTNSRQAVIHIKNPSNTVEHPTKDMNCTVCLQFFIRDNALHMTTYMRSNDLWMGFPNDVFQFTCIQIRMAMELGVDIGYYTHIAGSLHLYERDYKKSLENMKAEEEMVTVEAPNTSYPCNCNCRDCSKEQREKCDIRISPHK